MRVTVFVAIVLACAFPAQLLAIDAVPERLPAQILVENLQGKLGAAGDENMRDITPIGFQLIQAFEPWSSKPVNDASDYCTVGFGHILSLQPCEFIDTGKYGAGISLSEASELLRLDARYARSEVERVTEHYLNDDQFSAVTAFVFSVGSESFESSAMLSMINSGDIAGASAEFTNWIRLGGRVVPSLVARRSCEQKLYVSALKLGDDGKISPDKC